MDEDIIYAEDVLQLFDGKMTHRILMRLVHAKKLRALKLGNRYVFSKAAVLDWRNRMLGIRELKDA